MRSQPITAAFWSLAITLIVASACENPSGLPAATDANRVDTIDLWAASGTALYLPSGYAVRTNEVVRTDLSSTFDVVFDLNAQGQAELLPTGVFASGISSAVRIMSESFASITEAPGAEGFQDSVAVPINVETVAVIRSRPVNCLPGLTVFFYAKSRVLEIDLVQRRVRLEILANSNCGYTSLAPGTPTR